MSKEIIDLLEKARNACKTVYPTEYTELPNYLDQALILLKQQPPAGEFTKQVRLSAQKRESIIAKITNIEILAVIGWIPQLCDRLDRAEAINKDLLAALKELAATFVGLPEGSIGGQAMKKGKAAIAKAKQ